MFLFSFDVYLNKNFLSILCFFFTFVRFCLIKKNTLYFSRSLKIVSSFLACYIDIMLFLISLSFLFIWLFFYFNNFKYDCGYFCYYMIIFCFSLSMRNLRKVSPLVLNRKITEDVYTKIETAVHIIAKRYWLVIYFSYFVLHICSICATHLGFFVSLIYLYLKFLVKIKLIFCEKSFVLKIY